MFSKQIKKVKILTGINKGRIMNVVRYLGTGGITVEGNLFYGGGEYEVVE